MLGSADEATMARRTVRRTAWRADGDAKGGANDGAKGTAAAEPGARSSAGDGAEPGAEPNAESRRRTARRADGNAEVGADNGAEGSPEAEPGAWSGTDDGAKPGADPDAESSQRDLSLPPLADCCVTSQSVPTWPSPCHLPTQSQLTRVPRCNGTRNTESAPAHVAVGLETLSLLPQKRGVVWRQALTRKSRESHVVATHASPTVQRDSRH